MRRLVVLLWIMTLTLWGTTAVTPAYAQEEPTVQAVMFWIEGCGHCVWVKENVLPPLAAQYGDQWQLTLIELSSAGDFDQLFDLGASLGIPRNNIGVPFLLIGDAVLIGSEQIPAELPGLIERYLAAGGVAYPTYSQLAHWLPQEEACLPAQPCPGPARSLPPVYSEAEAQEVDAMTRSLMETTETGDVDAPLATPARDGFLLATMILIGMVLALGYTAVRLWQAKQGKVTRQPPHWVSIALPLLALVGLGVAAYLAYVETQAVTAVCGPIGDCNAVQTSAYAYLFGIPIGVLGVVGYLAILGMWAWHTRQNDHRAILALVGMTAFGVLFSIYLTYLEPFVIGAVCAWCLTSAVVMTLLLVMSVETAVSHLSPEPT
ncbi:MAG TPA: vitamin K epoxide reductase family protein [Chloroflexota bacterium]|nr:vitamin K epoxide reductase family protein [Chloroflexota bacterium]